MRRTDIDVDKRLKNQNEVMGMWWTAFAQADV
jgi:hypothetical protein